ncbi:anthranilate synthase component I family protein [Arenivirga flava]|uniref:Chorismate-utilising enzyme C-terminal domain-containing protein n=1 Tax=Arenivirga flava TaxID=1930060 RepID=A0AA37UT97_9MICO|nr:anthranilate synthase component I family protein [Arenivirga flava]GMA27922.1 hypothetical protein GCM10025874_11750 [Arenivirga flava]
MHGRDVGGLLPGWVEPFDAARALAGEGHVALLEATDGRGTSTLVLGSELVDAWPEVPLDPAAGDRPLWAGWLDYEGGARFLRAERWMVFDHARREVRASGIDLCDLGDAAPEPVPVRRLAVVRWRHDDDTYLAMIEACKRSIERGDAYLLCLTNTARVGTATDPWTAYARLRSAAPTHHAGLLRLGGTTLVSASPERFLEIDAHGLVRSSPIKGTRRRDPDPLVDDALAEELGADAKERAENVMIVDLVRNDLSRIAVPGSVRVTRLLDVERYATVHQLVSTVEGRLRDGLGAGDAVRSLFPAGSMTGAPKRSAMAILRGLERAPRGVYSGAFGLVRADGSVDLAMVIRSIVFAPDGVTVGAGGGITALSEPAFELAEVRLKADRLLSVLDGPLG